MAQNGVYHDGPIRARSIPHSVLQTSPVSIYRNPRELPLDLIQRIITYIDDVADIARATRASRLFYYMALPRLYERMTLKSYPELRYIDGEPEGYGGGSPFSMGLLGLVTKNVAGYVKHWKVTGEWRERDVEEFLKGRIPDNSMMLTISIRAAMDRMTLLDSFWWDMNAKPMSTIYQGLTLRPTLTSLRIKSPTQRVIRPTTIVPPIPTLKELWLSDIDPLCYPDDFSVLLLHSRRLRKINLHWSPRMREQGEPSINLHSLLGKCIAAGYHMSIEELGIMNMYSPNQGELQQAMDPKALNMVAFVNCVDAKNPRTVFFDQTWANMKETEIAPNMKVLRSESIDRGQMNVLRKLGGLEGYFVISRNGADRKRSPLNGAVSNSVSSATSSPDSHPRTPYTPVEHVSLAADFLAALRQYHSHSLRKLLLSDQWSLSEATLISFVKACPNLEQFGFGLDGENLGTLGRVLPHAPKLTIVRLIHANYEEMWTSAEDESQLFNLTLAFARPDFLKLRIIGINHRAFLLGAVVDEPYTDAERGINVSKRRLLTQLSPERTNAIDLWRMDAMDLF